MVSLLSEVLYLFFINIDLFFPFLICKNCKSSDESPQIANDCFGREPRQLSNIQQCRIINTPYYEIDQVSMVVCTDYGTWTAL